MDEHHGEATKTSVLWKKSNSIHPGCLVQSKGFPGNTFMNSLQGLEACEPRVLELEWSRADEGVEVTLVRNHLK